MRPKARATAFGCIGALFLSGVVTIAYGQTRIAPSGSTVVSAALGLGKATVTIYTAAMQGSCESSCPRIRPWMQTGFRQLTVVQKIEISVDGQAVHVPRSGLAGLLGAGGASLGVEGGSFVLKISGGDGALAYYVLIFFDRERVTRQLTYVAESDAEAAEDIHYRPGTLSIEPGTRPVSIIGVGSTTLSAESPQGKATVTIRTVKEFDARCAGLCAGSRPLEPLENTNVSSIAKIEVSTGGHSEEMMPSIYMAASERAFASLAFDQGSFVLNLEVRGADGAGHLLWKCFFDGKGVERISVYDPQDPREPLSDMHFHPAVFDR